MRARLPIYQEAIRVVQKAGVPFAIIGGMALLEYGRTDITKDIDLFVTQEGALKALNALAENSFETRRTDEVWIYHAFKNSEEVDLIFCIGRGFLDEPGVNFDPEMLARAHPGRLGEVVFPVISPEDLILTKMVVSWKELRQYDWQHLLLIIKNVSDIDWRYILRRSHGFETRLMALLAYAATCEITENALPPELKKGIETLAERGLEKLFPRRAA